MAIQAVNARVLGYPLLLTVSRNLVKRILGAWVGGNLHVCGHIVVIAVVGLS